MKIVIAGAGGLVGQAFTKHFSNGHRVLPLVRSQLDVSDARAVNRRITDEKPDLIINCAVLGVEKCEIAPSLARSVNVKGAENLARAAALVDSEFLHISTNYVFDGRRENGSFYTVEDIPMPINIYGQTKLAGEHAVRSVLRRCFIVRTSWIFGGDKESFFCTAHRFLSAGKKIRAITDVWASSTYVRDFAVRVSEIISRRNYSTYHVVNSGLCSYYDFALEAARVLNLSATQTKQLIEPIKLRDLQHCAERPRYTPMHCIVSEKIGIPQLRDWREALAEYIYDDYRPNQ